MAPTGTMPQVASTWQASLEFIANNKVEEASSLAAELQASGGKLSEAAAAHVLAIAALRKGTGQLACDLVEALRSLQATWSEAAVLLAGGASTGATSAWVHAAGLAAAVAAKATGDTSSALAKAARLAREVGITWTEKLTAATAGDLLGPASEDETSLREAVDLPHSISEPAEKAAALVRAALAQLQQEVPQEFDAQKDAKEALAAFRSLSSPEGEATALLAVSAACLNSDAFASLKAANQALLVFSDLKHSKGQAASLHAIARAQLSRQHTDDCIFRAGEAIKLSRQLGDRVRLAAVLETVAEANLVLGAGQKALAAAREALTVAKALSSTKLEIRALCLISQAQAACEDGSGEFRDSAARYAKDALDMCEDLGPSCAETFMALDAVAAADPSEATKCGHKAAEKFGQGHSREQGRCKLIIASIKLADELHDQALRVAQEALKCFKEAGDRVGQAQALKLSADVHLAKEEPAEAMRLAAQACSIYRTQPFATKSSRKGEIACIQVEIAARVMLGAFEEAFSLAVEHGKRFKGLKEKQCEGMVLLIIASLHNLRLESEAALKVLLWAPGLFNAVGDKEHEGMALQEIARSYLSRGEVSEAARAAEACAAAFRCVGKKKCLAEAAAITMEAQFALASVKKGNPAAAVDAAEEALSLYRELGMKQMVAVSLHSLANAYCMVQRFQDGLQAAQEAQSCYRELQMSEGEAGALVLEAGSHLGLQDFGEARRCAAEARRLYDSEADSTGAASASDFLDQVSRYENGEIDPAQFGGFVMRRVESKLPSSSRRDKDEAEERRRERVERLSRQSDIEVVVADPSRTNSRLTITYFEGFETRAGVGRSAGSKQQRPEQQAQVEEAASYSKEYKDKMQQGYPEKEEPVIFSVRWVQASEESKKPAAGNRRKNVGSFLQDEDLRVVSTGKLGAPNEDVSCYGKSDRLEPDGESHFLRRSR
eukprot:TRINITY_DN36619_c0_g1_i1.p1 TRINITY_DN36619_c0_g1~~TRINITY_DN36619_c0_g1_i1.p1  ORF type:complete len:949 (-),score=273.28 TRINITY_DN36619_c0_g1_i1:52-2898(-)